jgi:hypothetical protein
MEQEDSNFELEKTGNTAKVTSIAGSSNGSVGQAGNEH